MFCQDINVYLQCENPVKVTMFCMSVVSSGDIFVVTQGNMTQLTYCARITHSDSLPFIFVFNIVVGMFTVTRGWDGLWVGSNRFVNG